jgi:hypothetical protein
MAATGTLKKALRNTSGGVAKGPSRTVWLAAVILALLWLTPGCPPPPGAEDLKKEVEGLKTEAAALKEKVNQLEANQKLLTELIKVKAAAQVAGTGSTELPGLPPAPGQAAGTAMTLEELFKTKDQLLGTRVTVKGLPGPVMMHKKTLFLGGPGGMVEVIYGNLPDKKQVERLTSQAIETPLTVSGLLSAAPGQGQGRLVIMADSVEF